WAFIGEGISHSGFGGAGTVWLAAAVFHPLDQATWAPYVGVVIFSLATACGIAYFTRGQRVNSDAAIGIFLVASLAWGILAQQIYSQRLHHNPFGWENFLFGYMTDVSPPFAIGAMLLCAAVVAVVVMLGKEIV